MTSPTRCIRDTGWANFSVDVALDSRKPMTDGKYGLAGWHARACSIAQFSQLDHTVVERVDRAP